MKYALVLIPLLGFIGWVTLRLLAPIPERDPLSGVLRTPNIWWWLAVPQGVEERPIRRWEWLIAYALFGVILALNWLVERVRGRPL
jgi:hypothetical protein